MRKSYVHIWTYLGRKRPILFCCFKRVTSSHCHYNLWKVRPHQRLRMLEYLTPWPHKAAWSHSVNAERGKCLGNKEYGKEQKTHNVQLILSDLLSKISICTLRNTLGMQAHHLAFMKWWTYAAIHVISTDQICSSQCGWHTSVTI